VLVVGAVEVALLDQGAVQIDVVRHDHRANGADQLYNGIDGGLGHEALQHVRCGGHIEAPVKRETHHHQDNENKNEQLQQALPEVVHEHKGEGVEASD